jgi:hypothetical protein
MLRHLAILLVLMVALPLFAAAPLLQDPGLYDYLGDLNGHTIIGMTLHQREGQKISGSYFYKKYLKDIPLTGEFTGERDLVLRENDAKGQLSGTFTLHFADSDPRHTRSGDAPLTVDVLIGKWTNADQSKSYPVYLALATIVAGASDGKRYQVAGATGDSPVERNVQAFCAAVEKGDRKAVAGHVSYPVMFSLEGKRSRAMNEQEFLADYDRIFTAKFVEKIRNSIPHNMFANSDGIMIGDGAVWFDEKGRVKGLNN